MKRKLLVVAMALLIAACTRRDTPAPARVSDMSIPFRESWVRGIFTWEARAANAPSVPLPLTVSLALSKPEEAIRQLNIGPLTASPCYEVRLLYRPQPSAPSVVVGPGTFDLPGLWSEPPVTCLHVGTEWSWRLLLHPSRGPWPPDADGRLAVIAGKSRTTTEQFAVMLTRRPRTADEQRDYSENIGRLAVATSEWVSLRNSLP